MICLVPFLMGDATHFFFLVWQKLWPGVEMLSFLENVYLQIVPHEDV